MFNRSNPSYSRNWARIHNYDLRSAAIQSVDILWVYPLRFQKVIARFWGMHLLVLFIGCIGNLMKNSSLEEVLASAFAGVEKMLKGSKYFTKRQGIENGC